MLMCALDGCLLFHCLVLCQQWDNNCYHASQSAVCRQVEKHLADRGHTAQAFVKTLVTHAKRLYTEHPHYKSATDSTMHDIDRRRQMNRLRLASGQYTETPSPEIGNARPLRVPPGQPFQMGPSTPAPAAPTPIPEEQNLTEEERRITNLQFKMANYARVQAVCQSSTLTCTFATQAGCRLLRAANCFALITSVNMKSCICCAYAYALALY